jgi:hypothetical protein
MSIPVPVNASLLVAVSPEIIVAFVSAPPNWVTPLVVFNPLFAVVAETHFGILGVPELYSRSLSVVLKISNPVAGLVIASRSVVAILGIKSPLFVEVMSSAAEELGVRVPIPTLPFCAIVVLTVKSVTKTRGCSKCFIIGLNLD